MHFAYGPLVSVFVLLLVPFLLRRLGCRLRVTDEVLGLLVRGDVDVCFSEELFRGGWSFLEDGSDEIRVIRYTI